MRKFAILVIDNGKRPTMKKTVFILTIILLSSFKGLNDESATGLSKACQELAGEFSKDEHGHLVYNQNEDKYIQPKDFASVLLNISKYDLKQGDSYQIEKKDSGSIRQTIWTGKQSDNIINLKKRVFVATGDKCKGITITDYYINRRLEPTYIHLRLLENEFHELTIGQIKYSSFSESILVGADDALRELRLIEKKNKQ